MSKERQAAVALAGAAQWCEMAAPIFGGPPGESYEAWIDRMLEFGLAARGGGYCELNDKPHDYGPWEHAHWRPDRARRDCLKCGHFELGRMPLRRCGFDDDE